MTRASARHRVRVPQRVVKHALWVQLSVRTLDAASEPERSFGREPTLRASWVGGNPGGLMEDFREATYRELTVPRSALNDHKFVVASMVNWRSGWMFAELAWSPLAGAVCPDARSRIARRVSCAPVPPFWIEGRKDVWEDPGFWELPVHGSPPYPPASPDPPGKSGNLARLPSRSHHPPPPDQVNRQAERPSAQLV
jgi:hypothetical protein